MEAKPRNDRGKNAARRLRAQGFLPITVYGGGKETRSANLVKHEFAALLRAHGRNVIFTLKIDGAAAPERGRGTATSAGRAPAASPTASAASTSGANSAISGRAPRSILARSKIRSSGLR